MNKRKTKQVKQVEQWRFYTVFALISLVFIALVARAAYLQVIEPERLRMEGDNRTHRHLAEFAHRGMITDRNGLELAISAPVNTVWADPLLIHDYHNDLIAIINDDNESMAERDLAEGKLNEFTLKMDALANILDLPLEVLHKKIGFDNKNKKPRRFVYLGRNLPPSLAEYIAELAITGVHQKAESKRYYPYSEVSAHLVGLTDVDDVGIEGIEKRFNTDLTGKPGSKHVLKDARGSVIEVLSEEKPKLAQDIVLSIDQKIQAVAYQELKKAVQYYEADSGSLVMIDVTTGEILSLVNSPSFNPNNRKTWSSSNSRNRAVTDSFEPGSAIKPLVVLAALEFGSVKPGQKINTSPGWMKIGGRRVRDSRNYGEMDLVSILQKSSNVGVTKLALSMPEEQFLDAYYNAGFGSDTGSGIVGESSGVLDDRGRWSDFELATLSFGYGLSVTSLQLAQFYATIASGGLQRPLSILKLDKPNKAERVFSSHSSKYVLKMMESVTEKGGTGTRAAIQGYRVAGKTGTSRKAIAGGYGHDYYSSFAGIAPMSKPRIATVVVVNNPKGDVYYGGDVAAPVFKRVVKEALRVLNQTPDHVAELGENNSLRVVGVGADE